MPVDLEGVSGLFPSSLQSFVQSGGALLCLVLVKPLPKAWSSNIWLCHTSQKESEGKGGGDGWVLGFRSSLSSWDAA